MSLQASIAHLFGKRLRSPRDGRMVWRGALHRRRAPSRAYRIDPLTAVALALY
ncbi:hypothetical protein COLSTE_01382 [Collinsella stercoris DSM 13279]|uniref:Uncharacterized protein n=1 Tax=Collinsella stercoris DSM 13279 TaxID=445975 RepID=B6GBC3_9ACTN|nr:hypothetical protein COLSTE_01382 [Collinsella stercoris DSM 13279]